MTKSPTPDDRLEDIVLEAQFALELALGKSVFYLSSDRLLFHALCRVVSIIGEAASHVPIWMKAEMSSLQWRRIVGMRNLIVHQYWMVDPSILLTTINNQFPALVSTVEAWRKTSRNP
jgi:uncharacterized protein with HEPN domain